MGAVTRVPRGTAPIFCTPTTATCKVIKRRDSIRPLYARCGTYASADARYCSHEKRSCLRDLRVLRGDGSEFRGQLQVTTKSTKTTKEVYAVYRSCLLLFTAVVGRSRRRSVNGGDGLSATRPAPSASPPRGFPCRGRSWRRRAACR